MHVISKDAIETSLRSMQHFKQHGEIPQQDRERAMADLVAVFGDDYIDERRITLMLTTAWERATKNCGGDAYLLAAGARGGRVSGLEGALDLLVLSQCVSRHGASVRLPRVWRFTASLTCCQGAAFLANIGGDDGYRRRQTVRWPRAGGFQQRQRPDPCTNIRSNMGRPDLEAARLRIVIRVVTVVTILRADQTETQMSERI